MEKTISFQNKKGFYTDSGSGKTLILVHGFGEDGSVWDALRETLSKKYRVLAPDLPGYRHSELPESALTIEYMADFLKAILDIEKIEHPAIIGHSMGGYVTLALTEKYPHQPERIGLFHSHAFADDAEKKAGRRKAIEFVGKNGTDGFIHELYNNLFGSAFIQNNKSEFERLKEKAKKYPPETIMSGLQAMAERPDRTHVLKSFRNLVLFILGKEDKAIPWEKSIEQSQFPAVSDIHVFENAGHMGMLEEPVKSLNIIEVFMELNF